MAGCKQLCYSRAEKVDKRYSPPRKAIRDLEDLAEFKCVILSGFSVSLPFMPAAKLHPTAPKAPMHPGSDNERWWTVTSH